jgi:hypothetical protein
VPPLYSLTQPYILHTLGFAPGLLLILAVATATTWADYVVGVFKLSYPEVYSLPDVMGVMWGAVGREVGGVFFWLAGTAVAGAGLVGLSTAFNAVSDHAMCTVAWVVVSAVIITSIASIQTLDRISWLGWVGVFSIMASIITLAVAVGVQDRPSAAPPTGPWSTGVVAVNTPSFTEGITAVASAVFAYAGAPSFLNIAAEMRRPQDYTKALLWCQGLTTVTYMVIGSVVYHFCGMYVASPALGSAGPLLKKVSCTRCTRFHPSSRPAAPDSRSATASRSPASSSAPSSSPTSPQSSSSSASCATPGT